MKQEEEWNRRVIERKRSFCGLNKKRSGRERRGQEEERNEINLVHKKGAYLGKER